jgi:hypothetical protein
MDKNTKALLKERNYFVHDWLVRAGDIVNAEQFAHVFSENAPPIGWHLWHMARFADRLQSKLTNMYDSKGAEIWYRDNVCQKWGLSPEDLGVFESGMGQLHKHAQFAVAQAGQPAIVAYAKAVFEACNAGISKLGDDDFDKTYYGILDYGYDGKTGKVWASDPKESTVAQDLIFHVTHGSRHMGMMEALRGLLGNAGTLSV